MKYVLYNYYWVKCKMLCVCVYCSVFALLPQNFFFLQKYCVFNFNWFYFLYSRNFLLPFFEQNFVFWRGGSVGPGRSTCLSLALDTLISSLNCWCFSLIPLTGQWWGGGNQQHPRCVFFWRSLLFRGVIFYSLYEGLYIASLGGVRYEERRLELVSLHWGTEQS